MSWLLLKKPNAPSLLLRTRCGWMIQPPHLATKIPSRMLSGRDGSPSARRPDQNDPRTTTTVSWSLVARVRWILFLKHLWLAIRFPAFSYRYMGKRRRQRYRRRTTTTTTTTNTTNQKTKKKRQRKSSKKQQTTADNTRKQTTPIQPAQQPAHQQLLSLTRRRPNHTRPLLPRLAETLRLVDRRIAQSRGGTRRQPVAGEAPGETGARNPLRGTLTYTLYLLLLSHYSLFSAKKLFNKTFKNDVFPVANTHTRKRKPVRIQVRCRVRNKRRSIIHLNKVRRKTALQMQEKRLEKAKRCITCAGDVSLSNAEILVLAKGLTFVPTESRPNRYRLLKKFDSLACIMSERNKQTAVSYERHPYAPPSKWVPTTTNSDPLEEYIRKIHTSIKNMPVTIPKFNLTLPELRALKVLGRRTDIVIKKADKGACIVVQSRDEYVEKGTLHVNDTKKYTPLDANPTAAIGEAINNSVQGFLDANLIDQITANYLRHDSPDSIQTQVLYLLRKRHKNPSGFRSKDVLHKSKFALY